MSDGQLLIRPMDEDDLEVSARVIAAAFEWDLSAADLLERMRYRIWRHMAAHPGASYVSEVDGAVTGMAQACRYEAGGGRPGLWVLSLLGVDPGAQSAGAGRELLRATLDYRRHADGALIVGSDDHRALRLYTRAGLAPQPSFQASGVVDRSRLRVPSADIELGILGADDDLDLIAPITTQVRGAPYGDDLRFLLARGGRLLHAGDRGWALLDPHGVGGLVAADTATAQALLWRGLAESDPDQVVYLRWLTATQQWAIEIALAAGLKLETRGALFAGGRVGTLEQFLPTGPFA